MSFILDALKKSETERQRQSIPGLVDTRPGKRRAPLPTWAIALGALLAVNVVVLSVFLVRSWSARPAAEALTPHKPDTAAARNAPAQGQTNAPPKDHFSPLDSAPVYAPEIPVDGNSASPAAAPRRTAPPVTNMRLADAARAQDAENSSASATHRRDPVLTQDADRANDDETLPSISELSLSGAQALPELHLDVHVYSTKPAERFVYINMRKYHEGATLQEGPVIERIRRDGAVLNYQGLRFLLPRQ